MPDKERTPPPRDESRQDGGPLARAAADPMWQAVIAAKDAVERIGGEGDAVYLLAAAEVKMAAFVAQALITEQITGETPMETLTNRNAAIVTAQCAVYRLSGDPRAATEEANAARAATMNNVLLIGEACLNHAARAEAAALLMSHTSLSIEQEKAKAARDQEAR